MKITNYPYTYHTYTHDVVVVGSGAAGLNCADLLYRYGICDTALVTEGMKMGTSRNTGSDKQTYYKLTVSGGAKDSVYDMAQSLFDGGSMHGDLALIEAASSPRAFFRLVELGVPFPFNDFGEYAGYKTDHDERTRATSCGPLTSKYMTEALERAVLADGLPIYDNCRVIGILTDEVNGRRKASGIVTVSRRLATGSNPLGLTVFACRYLVWATGGPSAMYEATVYPPTQSCAHGTALLAGAEGVNLTESQYGIASTKFRWNLSGSYQQVIPRYVSVGEDGEAREFLAPYFADETDMFGAIFLKGYQWPFDPRKARGSSRVDMAVYNERQKGRRVFLDFMHSPEGYSPEKLTDEARQYLDNSDAHGATPYERLEKLNRPAIDLYLSHNIDISRELLEIDVCAQHNNGGLAGDVWYESTTLSGFFPIGEANGVFGVYRPGGSALNSTQVSSLRAAERIREYMKQGGEVNESGEYNIPLLDAFSPGSKPNGSAHGDILGTMAAYRHKMSENGAFIRNYDGVCGMLNEVERELDGFFDTFSVTDCDGMRRLAILYDVLNAQRVYLAAIKKYIEDGGRSRGSYLINDDPTPDTLNTGRLCYVRLNGGDVAFRYEDARPIPRSEQWFEKVYNAFRMKRM